TADAWTQMADFGGSGRYGIAGFTLNGKGYIVCGYDTNELKEFWEYDPDEDSWTQLTDFASTQRAYAVGFAVGSYGYLTCGVRNSTVYKDLWKW
ncbi:MAG: galactose oxidase, partial [Candidatus Bathyarchaeia archaeon]